MALDQARRWRDLGLHVPVSVNLSVRLFEDAELVPRVLQAMAARGLAPELLTLEITETALMTRPEAARESLSALRTAGVGISIDDFGAGFTSLRYLRDFEVSEIKIDKLFVQGLRPSCRDVPIVRSIAALTRGFDAELVAEGVEDEALWPLLRELGCDIVQGLASGAPMDGAALAPWWRERRRRWAA
jgi:EAL domain-containing protein (putative c-di-GMP-specific phosphodiesterase class I)